MRTEAYKKNVTKLIWELSLSSQHQQNSVAERRIPTLMGRARAMLIQAGIDPKGKGEFLV